MSALGWTISDLRAIHTRAVGVRAHLQERKDSHFGGIDKYCQVQWQYWEDYSQRLYKKPCNRKPEDFRDSWPSDWAPEQQKALEDVTAVIRQLDQYALPKKQVFGGAVV